MASLDPAAAYNVTPTNVSVGGADNCPSYTGMLPRVTVILGSNGAGKSKLLRGIRLSFRQSTGTQNLLSFEPENRVGQPVLQPITLSTAILQDRQFREADHVGKPFGAGELSQTLNLLRLQYEAERDKWDIAYKSFEFDPKNPKMPQLPENQFETALKLYKQLIGIELRWNTTDRVVRPVCSVTGREYEASDLSGGEAWALRVVPDFVLRKDDTVTVFVDEPESYFNEALTLSFWSGIEAERPNWRFIYATHRVDFAARQGVEKVLLVKGKNKPVIELSDANQIPLDDYKAIMGYAPRVVKSERTLFIEGEPGSSDERFYQAALNDGSVLIMPVRDCNQVVKAVSGQETIHLVVRQGIKVRGIVDRDYSSHAKVSALQASGIALLDLHEWEAYLCLPQVIAAIAKRLVGPTQDAEAYRGQIVDWAKSRKMKTIAQHFNERIGLSGFVAGFGVPAEHYTDIKSIREEFFRRRQTVVEAISSRGNDTIAHKVLTELQAECDEAITKGDVTRILTIFSAKELFEHLKDKAAADDKDHAIRVIIEEDLFENIPELATLRAKLRDLFST